MEREELVGLLAKARAADNARGLRLLFVFAGLIALAFAPIGFFFLGGKLPKDLLLGFMGLALAAIVGLGIYILVSSRSFQARHGAKCPRCGAPIAWVKEALLLEAFGGYAAPEPVRCKGCGELLTHVRPRA